MATCIEKFINYETKKLESLKERLYKLEIEEQFKKKDLSIEKAIIEDTIVVTTNFIRLYSSTEAEWSNLSEIFNDFEVLCNELTSSNEFSYRDKTNIIFYIISKNLATKLLKDNLSVIDSREIIKYPFKTITKKELENMVLNSGFRRFFETDIELLSEKEQQQKEELEHYLAEHSLNIADIVKQHRTIQEHYFDKLDSFTKEDIEYIIEALKELKVTADISDVISKTLTTTLDKRTKKEKGMITSSTKKTTNENTKSYNEIQQELLKYYNFSQNMITAETRMSLSEIVNCITLLNELGAHKEQLYTFIKAATISNNQYEINPINLYNEQYYRLDYYKDKLGLQTEFENLQDLYQELFLLGGEDYEYGKKLFAEDLENYMKVLPNNSDYEIEQAKQLSKTRKEV